jgi:predicted nucleotidyltransferase
MVSQQKIEALINRIVKLYKPEKVVLFGSYAYGKPSFDSDVDLLVVLDFAGKNALKSAEILNTTNPDFPVDLIVRTPEQVQERIELGDFFIKEIFDRGKVLYESTYA